MIVHPGAVVVLAFRDDGNVLLIRNRRYAVDETLLELPAGTLEKGEDPMNLRWPGTAGGDRLPGRPAGAARVVLYVAGNPQ